MKQITNGACARLNRLSRRQFLKVALATSGSVGLLAACSAGQAPATSGGAAAPAAQSDTLTVWGWEGTIEGVQTQIAAFTKTHADFKVDVKTLGYEDTHTNLLNSIVAGSGAPDICAIDVL